MLNTKVAPSDGGVDGFYYHTYVLKYGFLSCHLKKWKHLLICVQSCAQTIRMQSLSPLSLELAFLGFTVSYLSELITLTLMVFLNVSLGYRINGKSDCCWVSL